MFQKYFRHFFLVLLFFVAVPYSAQAFTLSSAPTSFVHWFSKLLPHTQGSAAAVVSVTPTFITPAAPTSTPSVKNEKLFPTAPASVVPVVARVLSNNKTTIATSSSPALGARTPVFAAAGADVFPKNFVTLQQLQASLDQLSREFKNELSAVNSAPASGGSFNNIAISQRIDRLSTVDITNATVHGVSGLTASDIPALDYLALSGGTLTGTFTSTAAASSTFANGINITAGCFSVGGVCITASGGATVTLSGDVSGSGTTAITTTIGALKVLGTMIANATIDLTTKVTGMLPIANGGTNTSSQTSNGVNYFDGTKITSGTGLVFDGTSLGVATTSPTYTLTTHGNFWFDQMGASATSIIGTPTLTSFAVSALVPASSQDMLWIATTSAGTNSMKALIVNADYEGTSAVNISGINAGAVLGSNATANQTGTTNGGSLRNLYVAANKSLGRNVAQSSALAAQVAVAGTLASTTDGASFQSLLPSVGSGNLLTNAYGLWVRGGASSGTITNQYGIYVDSLVAGTNRYGVYQAGTSDKNYFAGNTGVGTTSPFTKFSLHANNGETNSILFAVGSSTATATTTLFSLNNIGNAYVAGTVGIGSTSPTQALGVNGSIDIPLSAGYKQENNTILRVWPNIGNLLVGSGAGTLLPGTDTFTTAIGYRALGATTGSQLENTAVGWQSQYVNQGTANTSLGVNAMGACTSCNFVTAIGNDVIRNATSTGSSEMFGTHAGRNNNGSFNIGIGVQALQGNESATTIAFTGSSNIGIGYQSMLGNAATTANLNTMIGNLTAPTITVGGQNIGMGQSTLTTLTSGSRNTVIGTLGGGSLTSGSDNTFVGNLVGNTATGDYNLAIGTQAGTGLTSGSYNILLVTCTNYAPCGSAVTSGQQNVVIGYDVSLPSSTANGQLNIANMIYGTGNTAFGTTISSGKLGVGTSTPFARLSIQANNSDTNTTLFAIGSSTASATTTLFSVSNTGAVAVPQTLQSCGGVQTNASGVMSCTSDARLKDIQAPFVDGLSAISKIDPQTYVWKQDSPLYDGGVEYSGFIAQNIQEALPNAVNTNGAGFLQINVTTILAATVNAIKEIAQTVAGFANSFTTKQLCLTDGSGGQTCITKNQLDTLLAGQSVVAPQQNSAPAPAPAPTPSTATPPPAAPTDASTPE